MPKLNTTTLNTPLFPQYKKKEISEEERANIIETQKAYYDPYFQREKERLTSDYQVNKEILSRLMQYSKTDTARDLAKTNKTFAKTMSKASNIYGKRNILGSGIQKQVAEEMVGGLEKDVYNREDYARRKEEGIEDRQANIKTKFSRGITEIGEQQQAQTYFDTLKEIESRKSEFTRQFGEDQQNIDFNTTTNTTPKNKTYKGRELTDKEKLLF